MVSRSSIKLDRLGGNGLFQRPFVGLGVLEMRNHGRCARIKHAAVDPLGTTLAFQLLQIPPNGGFGDRQYLCQLGQGGKTPHSNKFQQSICGVVRRA